MDYCLGIDIGGTKTAVCIADLNGKIIETGKFPTEPQLGVNSLIEKIVDCYKILCLKSNVKSSQIRFAGVASPGPLDLKTGRIVNIATMGFVDVPIKDIANIVGFKTVQHFNRIFKEHTGTTPAEFRKTAVERRKKEI